MSQNQKILGGIFLLAFMFLLPYIPLYFGLHMHSYEMAGGILLQEAYVWSIPLIMTFYTLRTEQQNLVISPESSHSFGWYLKNFILLFLGIMAIGLVVAQIVKLTHSDGRSVAMDRVFAVLKHQKYLIWIVSATAGITEEILFRGYLFSRLEKLFRHPLPAILLASLGFGLVHLGYGTLQQFLFPFFMGVLFTWHYHKYRNLKVLIVLHFFFDFMVFSAHTR